MTIQDLDMKQIKTLITPSHLHHMLRLQFTQEQQGNHITLLSLSTFLKQQVSDPIKRIDVLLQYREVLRSYQAHHYQNILTSLDFCEQCYDFLTDLKLYGIALEALPEHNEAQKEMKAILSLLYPLKTWQDQENEIFSLFHETSLNDVTIISHMWNAQDQFRIAKLKQCGATIIPLVKKQPDIMYYHAMNKRKEVEVLAQTIIKKQLRASDLHIMVCDSTYPLLIKQVFERYHIPCTILKKTSNDFLATCVQLYLSYAYQPCMETLLNLLEGHALQVPYHEEFIEYVTLFDKTMNDPFTHIETDAKVSQLVQADEIQRLLRLEEHARQCKEMLHLHLKGLTESHDPKTLLMEIDRLLAMHVKHDRSALSSIHQLHDLFQAYLPYFHNRSDIPFLIECCAEIHSDQTANVFHGAFITDLQHPLLPGKTAVVLGCIQKQYPAFPLKKGLFDEAYIKQLPTYPDMNQRHHQYMEQLETLLFAYDQLIVSYPLGTYDGKNNESSLEMEQLLKTPIKWQDVNSAYQRISLHETITKDSAKALFVKKGELRGSISALERYGKCPFSYFLRYGLKIKEPIDYRFSPSRIGTLSHYILETLVEQYGKSYPYADQTEIATLLDNELTALSDVYLRLRPQLPILKQRLIHAIMSNLHDLGEMEKHSALTPFACEQEFYWKLPLFEDVTLTLHGFIDRIDTNATYLRIIDYKSSIKELSETNVFAGLQLQLMIYALYAKKTWNKEVLGAFYWSMKNENITAHAGKITRRPVAYIRYDQSDWESQRFAAHRLRGWVLHHDVEVIDDNGSHIVGVKESKDGIKARKVYPLAVMETVFMDILKQLTKRILAGDIACNPTQDACLFCPYHEICRFHGYPRTVEPLVDIAQVLEQEGE